ncbi:MAG: hypothetical protein AAFR51_03885 [Pseudomonadota bacterium]
MPISECDTCGGQYSWRWEEAFHKFGFNDGDGQVETYQVEHVLTLAGYVVEVRQWGFHNTVIISIKDNSGCEFIDVSSSDYTLGYDDPRTYLPKKIVRLLDKNLPEKDAD